MLKLNPADRYPPEAGRYIEATTIPGDSLRHSAYFCLGNTPEPNGLAMVCVLPWVCACRNVTNRERRAKAEDRRALAKLLEQVITTWKGLKQPTAVALFGIN